MRNINVKIKLVLLCLFACRELIYAQGNYSNYYFPEPPKAPSSEAFLKYGNVQNNEYSGTNAPSINLFNIRSGAIEVPVSINYISGNGIRVTDESSMVGLGWMLAFPTIVQNTYGYNDLDTSVIGRFRFDFAKSSVPYANNFPTNNGPTNFNDSPSFGSYGYYLAHQDNVPINGYYTSHTSGFSSMDMQPDVFIMNIFGERVEFIIDNFSSYNANNSSSMIFIALNKKGFIIKKTNEGFTVKDPKGFIYKFNSVENITSPPNTKSLNFLITEITDTNNNSVYFNYLNIDNVVNPISHSWILNYTINENFYCSVDGSNNLETSPYGALNPNLFALQGGFISYDSPVSSSQNYLLPLSITGNNGKLMFNYSDRVDFGTKKLDKISLLNHNNLLVQDCQFSYDYFLPNPVDPSNIVDAAPITDKDKRLKLLSLQKTNEEKYEFSYNETLLPPKGSFATDYWGYPNGGYNNKSAFLNPGDFNYNISIPIISNPSGPNQFFNNNNKLPNSDYAKGGILEKVFYPTKGYSLFNYELNEASNLVYQFNNYKYNKGNGLRLKSQRNYDYNNSLLNTTIFEYENGKTPNPIRLLRKDNAESFVAIQTCTTGSGVRTRQASFVAMHANSATNTFSLSSGSGIGYSKVIKKETDNNGNMKGWIETVYANDEDIHFITSDYSRPIFLPSVKGDKIENGSILNKSVFDANAIKLQEEKYNYTVQNSSFSYGVVYIDPIFNYYIINPVFQAANTPLFVTVKRSAIGYYPIYSTETILTDKENTEYVNGNSLITKTDFAYNSNNFITFNSIRFPDGKYNLEKTKYSTEKNNIRLINSNVLSVPLEKETIGNVINGASKRTSLIETKYDSSSHLNPTSVISYELNVNNGQNVPTTEVTYDLYDNKGNVLQYTTKSGIPTTIIWGYNQTQIIAKIEGGSYSQIMQAFGLDPNNATSYLQLEIVSKSDLDIDAPSEDVLLSKLDIFKKKAEFKDFNITTYAYDPLIGVKTITSASGFKEFYKYNIQNKLEKVIDSENNILKEFKYHYAPRLFYNSFQSQPFIRNNCGSSAIGGSYTYTVPKDKYSSYDSLAAANQLAQNEINANGQNMANTNGTCTPINCPLSMYINGGGSISVSNQNYRVQIGFSSGVGKPWTTTGVVIGKINGTCIPQIEKTTTSYSGGYIWNIVIKNNGDILIKKMEGLGSTGVPDNTTYNLDFNFPIN